MSSDVFGGGSGVCLAMCVVVDVGGMFSVVCSGGSEGYVQRCV